MAQLTFNVASGSDDGQAWRSGASYPPDGTINSSTGDEQGECNRLIQGGTVYYVAVGLIRFDTSALPSDAVVSAAQLRMRVFSVLNTDSRSLQAEWYASSNWPIDITDYVLNATGDALSKPLSEITDGAYNSFDLATFGGIVPGYSGLRLHITGGSPTGVGSRLAWYSKDQGTYDPPQLIVTYTVGGYQHKVMGIEPANIASIMGVPIANIAKVNGV